MSGAAIHEEKSAIHKEKRHMEVRRHEEKRHVEEEEGHCPRVKTRKSKTSAALHKDDDEDAAHLNG